MPCATDYFELYPIFYRVKNVERAISFGLTGTVRRQVNFMAYIDLGSEAGDCGIRHYNSLGKWSIRLRQGIYINLVTK